MGGEVLLEAAPGGSTPLPATAIQAAARRTGAATTSPGRRRTSMRGAPPPSREAAVETVSKSLASNKILRDVFDYRTGKFCKVRKQVFNIQ
jgi:hypothetical protein